MKKTFLIISVLMAAAIAMVSCRPDSIVPESPDGGQGPGGGGRTEEQTVSIAFLKTLYKGAPLRITGEYRISGAVVSNDRQGNFYKTLVLDDGTGGIEIKLDLENICEVFWWRSKVTVRCNGLWLGSYGGTLSLGDEPFEGYETQYIPVSRIPEHLVADNEFAGSVVPQRLTFSNISAGHISTFVAFEGVQFADEELGLGWAENPSDTDTERHLVDPFGDTLAVRTSRYAWFAGRTIPNFNGYIEGVIGYFNGEYSLTVCDDQKAVMEGPRF